MFKGKIIFNNIRGVNDIFSGFRNSNKIEGVFEKLKNLKF